MISAKCPHNKTVYEECDECEIYCLKLDLPYWEKKVEKMKQRIKELTEKLKS